MSTRGARGPGSGPLSRARKAPAGSPQRSRVMAGARADRRARAARVWTWGLAAHGGGRNGRGVKGMVGRKGMRRARQVSGPLWSGDTGRVHPSRSDLPVKPSMQRPKACDSIVLDDEISPGTELARESVAGQGRGRTGGGLRVAETPDPDA